MDDRKTFIGGSDVACILGVSAYRGPIATWRAKCGLADDDDAPLFRAGRHMESFILREYERDGRKLRTGYTTADGREVWAQQTSRHPLHAMMGATLDAFAVVDGRVVIVDAKMSRKAIDEGDEETIPWDWQLQAHHYGWVCGIDRAEFAVCRTGADFSVVPVGLDLDLEWYGAVVVPKLLDFWRCVVERVEPMPVAPVERDPPPQLGEEAEAAALRLVAANEACNAAEARKEEARDDLRRILNRAGLPRLAMAGTCRVSSWLVSPRETIDSKALRADLPEVAEKYTKRGEAGVGLRVTAPKGKAA